RLSALIARRANKGCSLSRLYLLPLGSLPLRWIADALQRADDPSLVLRPDDPTAPVAVLDPDASPASSASTGTIGGRVAVPLGSPAAFLLRRPRPAGPARNGPTRRPAIRGMDEARAAALDTIKFFGHLPGVTVTAMPDAAARRQWWDLLPEYARFHREFATED